MIKKFITDRTTDLADFAAWLNSNKAGTFLADKTIEISDLSESNDNKVLTIDQNNVCGIVLKMNTGASMPVVEYNNPKGQYVSTTANYNTDFIMLEGALLCSKGLIFKFYGRTSSSYPTDYPLVITVDSNDNLSVIMAHPNILVTTTGGFTQYNVYSGSSTSAFLYNTNPTYDKNMTTMFPLIGNTNDANEYLPYAFGAVNNEFQTQVFGKVYDGEKYYITNSKWYIADE